MHTCTSICEALSCVSLSGRFVDHYFNKDLWSKERGNCVKLRPVAYYRYDQKRNVSSTYNMAVPSLVSCQWLHEKLESSSNRGNLVIIDVSWSSTKDCQEEYKQAHIPGAQYIDVLAADHTDVYPRNIPTSETFTTAAQNAGVDVDSHVIVYSSSDRAGFFLAGRGWWTFKLYGHENVSILDGGLSKWNQLKYPTTSECSQAKKGNFVAKRTNSIKKNLEDIRGNIQTPIFQLVDTRAGKAHQDGHIPNAKNVCLNDLIDNETDQLRSLDQLNKIFSDSNVDLKQPLVTHCNSGMSSCAVSFVATLLGAAEVAVFHGGYSEWTKKKDEN